VISKASALRHELMLASPGDDGVVDGLLEREAAEWWFERKLDGYRVVGISIDGVVRLRTRNGIDCSSAYPEVVNSLERQPYDNFVVDGEVVAMDETGSNSFELLQRGGGVRASSTTRPKGVSIEYVTFDLLSLDSVDVRHLSLTRRRGLLTDAFEVDDTLKVSGLLEGTAKDLVAASCERGWEGLIAKRIESAYSPGRSRNWYKLKCLLNEEMVIAGFTEPKGSRAGLGALVLGTFRGGQFVNAGRVGTGLDDETLQALRSQLEGIRTEDCPFEVVPPGLGAVNWVEPVLVCDVAFAEWTSACQLRHPRYRGLRPDKEARDVKGEHAVPLVTVSNADKLFYPALGVTKGEVVEYYDSVSGLMLAEVAERPLVVERFPNGVAGKSFYQKNTPGHTPDYIGRLPVESKGHGEIIYPVLHDLAGLHYLANQAALVFHTLLSGASDPGHPIEVIWDLDPAGDDVARVQKAAAHLKEVLDDLGLAPRVKSSGSKGLHIHVDVTDEPGAVSYEMSRAFAQRVAWELVNRAPEDFTLEFSKKERKGRLLIDVLRNGHASHAAAPYSLRAVEEAGVAAPLSWDEALGSGFHPRGVTIRTMTERLDSGIDPWAGRPRPTSTIAQAAHQLLEQ